MKAASVIATRMRAARESLGRSQAWLGAPVYSRQYISAIELGRTQPSLKALRHIASRLGLSLGDLTGQQTLPLDAFTAVTSALGLISNAQARASVRDQDALRLIRLALESGQQMIAGGGMKHGQRNSARRAAHRLAMKRAT